LPRYINATAQPTKAVVLSVGLGGYMPATFDAAAQAAFIVGTAAILTVNESDVRITNITAYVTSPTHAGGRCMLDAGVAIYVSVVAADAVAAAALKQTLAVATATSALSTALLAAGLTHVSSLVFLGAPLVKDIAAAPPPPPQSFKSAGASRWSFACIAMTALMLQDASVLSSSSPLSLRHDHGAHRLQPPAPAGGETRVRSKPHASATGVLPLNNESVFVC
jgi:hypothetical protein